MKNINIIISSDNYLIEQEIKTMIKDEHFEIEAISVYDLEEENFDLVLEDLDTYSLLTTKKLIIVNNAFFLKSSSKKLDEKLEKHFIDYLHNYNPDYYLILIANQLDARKKIVNELKKVANLIEPNVDLATLAKQFLHNYNLEPGSITTLLAYCDNNSNKLYQECEKLKLYCLDSKYITVKDVEQLVMPQLIINDQYIFDFVNAFIQKNKRQCLTYYYNLVNKLGFEPLSIIGLLANQFRLLYQVKVLLRYNYSKDQMQQMLKIHPYRIQKAIGSSYQYEDIEILNCLSSLAEIDFQIKSGEINSSERGLEKFILNL